jgi:uracil-DNA glycosylase family 4
MLGEKPGREEAKRGVPFVGISGKYLDLCMAAANVDRKACRINNLVSTFTEYSKPTAEEIARDHDALVADIVATDPEVIVLIGAWSVEHTLYRKPELDKCHGVPVAVTELFGGELKGQWVILPVIHPATAAHSPDSLNLVLDDLMALGKLLDGELTPVADAVTVDLDYRIVQSRELDTILRSAL